METQVEQFRRALELNSLLFGVELLPGHVDQLVAYYRLILRWSPRLHLVAPCSAEEFAVRHVLESLLLLKHLSPVARVADIGAGAGLPSIPCLLVRSDLSATLIESSQRKAVYLREALRELKLAERSRVLPERFEDTPAPDADFVTCRALDQFAKLLPRLIAWAPPHATFLLFAGESLRSKVQSLLPSTTVEAVPQSRKRFLVIAHSPSDS